MLDLTLSLSKQRKKDFVREVQVLNASNRILVEKVDEILAALAELKIYKPHLTLYDHFKQWWTGIYHTDKL